MAINKNLPVQKLDPAVEAAVGDDPIFGGINRNRIRYTNGQKKKSKRDQARCKVTYDWPPALVQRVNDIAAEHGVPVNQVAAVLAREGLKALDRGKIDLRALKMPSRVPRFAFFLNIEET